MALTGHEIPKASDAFTMWIKPEVTVTFPSMWLQSLNVLLNRTRTLTPRPHIAGWAWSCFLWGLWQSSHWLQRHSIMPYTGRYSFWRAMFLETVDICMPELHRQNKWSIYMWFVKVFVEGCICVPHMVETLIFQWHSEKFWWTIFCFTKDKDLQYQAVILGQFSLSYYSPRSHLR